MTGDERELSKERDAHWRNIEIVQLGEEFPLFDPERKRTQIRYSDGGAFGGMKAGVRLETDFFGKLNISISAAPYAKERYAVITPFDRQLGYPIDKDDLALHSRVVKMSKMKRDLAEVIQGLYLFVFVAHEDMASNGILQALLQEHATAPERDIAFLMRHLFLTLKFPMGSSFTARALFNAQQRMLLFSTFFPSDMGPLPRIGPDLKIAHGSSTNSHNAGQMDEKSEGFAILLPFDQAKLNMIRARFLYLPNLG